MVAGDIMISWQLQPRRAAERRESCISCLGPSLKTLFEVLIFSLCKSNCRLAWNYLTRTKPFGFGSIPIDTFLVGWTSIYQLFWGSLGTRVLTHSHLPAVFFGCRVCFGTGSAEKIWWPVPDLISQPPAGEDLFSEIPFFFHSTHKRYSTRYRSIKNT